MQEEKPVSNNETESFTCKWEEVENNKDWFYCGCIKQKVNIWKLCKKKHITPIQLFLSCPYCGKKVVLEKREEK